MIVRWLVCFVLVGGLANTAYAQSREAASLDAETQARDLHRRGSAAYDLGDFDGAIAAFQAAYRLSPAPGLLFNLGQAYRAKGGIGCADALRSYTAYLRALPEAQNRDIVRGHIAEMERCVEASRAAAPQKPAASDTAAQPHDEPSLAPPWPAILMGATGLVAVGVGVGLNVSARSEFDDLEAQCPRHDCDPASWEPYEDRETASFALFGVGAALVVGGALYWVIDAATNDGHPSSAQRRFRPSAQGFVLRW